MSALIDAVVSAAFVTQAVRIAVPLGCAAVGGALTERSGVIDLALEAKLLAGAFGAAVAAEATGSIAAGVAGGVAAAVLVALVQAWLTVRLAADQVVVGIALNLGAYGLTRYVLDLLYGSTASSPRTVGVGSAVWTSPVFWLAAVASVAVTVMLARAPLGLRIRAAGDRPAALAAAGVSVARVRVLALVIGGALAGLGGAQLALANHGFSAEMSAGRGYIALALVILAGWRPAWVAALCLAFGLLDAFQLQLQLTLQSAAQATGELSEAGRALQTFALVLPYVATLVVLAVVAQRSRAPRALGRADE